MTSNWVIGVLSTDYDLHEHRTAIINLFNNKGVVPSAFENPDFPVPPDMHSHDACLAALKRVDIAILIIDKRSGGVYVGSTKDTSITEQEFIETAKAHKPHFVFVSKSAWDERHSYKMQLKKSAKTQDDFDKNYVCTYVASVNVFHFIDQIQNAYASYGTSNWISQYTGIDDLKDAVEGKLSGLSQYYCYKIAKKQARAISQRKTSTSMMMSLGDVFSKGYYVEPDFKVESGELLEGEDLANKIVSTIKNEYSALIVGEAGYGKTTILAKSYLSHFESCRPTDYDIPFYLNLKSRGSLYHFDFFQYIEEAFAQYLEKLPYPFLNLSSIKPYFYLDSFDELAEKITTQDLQSISRSTIFSRPFLLTCRNQFAMRYIRSNEFASKISTRVKVNEWSIDKANDYINNFCIINKNTELLQNINGLLTENPELCDILDNPLLITMLLWVIEQNGLRVPETIKNRVQLFSECLKELAFREIERLQLSLTKEEMLIIWAFAAWEVYYAKIQKKDIQYQGLVSKLCTEFNNNEINESWFEALFMSNQMNIAGTFHEQFLEFLSAQAILLACHVSKYPFPEFLCEVVRPEINRYFRALWYEQDDDKKSKIIENIKTLYTQKLLFNDETAIMQRIHAVYHLSRLKYVGKNEFTNSALLLERNVSVRLSLFFGAIKFGDMGKEKELYQLISNNHEYSDANRGYHLAYYGDIVAEDKLPFKDNVCVLWPNTLSAFLRHFQSTEEGHYFLWRIDLLTMRQLMSARSSPFQVDEALLEQIKRLIYNRINPKYPDFQKSIEAEFEELVTYVNSLNQ